MNVAPVITAAQPLLFDSELDVLLLTVAGYTHEFHPENWEDVGGPESGPKLSGHPDIDVWTLPFGTKGDHEVVVIEGEVVSNDFQPAGPEGWEDQF